MKTFKQALKDGNKVGAANSQGLDQMAQMIDTLCKIHVGCNPKMIYEGAIKKGLTVRELTNLANHDPVAFGDLMFI